MEHSLGSGIRKQAHQQDNLVTFENEQSYRFIAVDLAKESSFHTMLQNHIGILIEAAQRANQVPPVPEHHKHHD